MRCLHAKTSNVINRYCQKKFNQILLIIDYIQILGCKTLQALSFCVKIEATEIEKEEAYEISRAQ